MIKTNSTNVSIMFSSIILSSISLRLLFQEVIPISYSYLRSSFSMLINEVNRKGTHRQTFLSVLKLVIMLAIARISPAVKTEPFPCLDCFEEYY